MSMSDEGEKKKQDISDGRKIGDLRNQCMSYDGIITKKLEEIQHKEEEVKSLEEQINKEQERIATLKKQGELRERETQEVIQDNQSRRKFTKIIMEGYLLMTCTGKEKGARRMYLWFERAHQGVPLLSWAPSQMSGKVERAILKSVESGKQAFKVELGFGKNFKAGSIQVHEQDPEILKSWVSELETALTTWKSSQSPRGTDTVRNQTLYVKELTFECSPLGFGVDTPDEKSKELKVSSIQSKDLLTNDKLKVGMTLTACNGKSLINVGYIEGMTILKAALANISAKNPVTIRFEGNPELLPVVTIEEKKIEDLYPDADVSLSIQEHPMLQNPEFSKHLKDEKFQTLCQELISDRNKLNEFLMRKDL